MADRLNKLSWEHRNDGHCGAGAPRWNLSIEEADGTPHTVFLGCAAAAHTPDTNNPDWTIDTYDKVAIEAQLAAQAGVTDPSTVKITSLQIIFDEQGFVYLDDITINSKVFSSSRN